jgi:ketosteroid isomerase-like protein
MMSMNKLVVITTIIVVGLAGAAVAQTPVPTQSPVQAQDVHADANPTAVSEIKALELKRADLIVKADWDAYAKYLASDYSFTRENGVVENKDAVMASLRDISRKIIVMEMEPSNFDARVYGDTAIASAEFITFARENGQVKNRRTRLTDVLLKRDGQWWIVAGHSTTIGK